MRTRLIRAFKSAAVHSLALTASLIEAPWFLVRNRTIFRNEIIYPLWVPSFGHSVVGIDFVARRYYPRRVSLIFFPHVRTNAYLAQCFERVMDTYAYTSIFGRRVAGHKIAFHISRVWFQLLRVVRWFQLLDYEEVRRTHSLARQALRCYGENGQLERAWDLTGYSQVLGERLGRAPMLPVALADRCRAAITRRYPDFFIKPFVTLLLRGKGKHGASHDAFRCVGDQHAYVDAVRYLTARGYHVVGSGETRHAVFSSIEGYFAFDGIDAPRELLNLYLLTHCVLFIGQQSGPHALPNAVGIPCCIVDAMPYSMGTFCADDLILFKPLRERATGRTLTIVEIFREKPLLAHGGGFEEHGIEVGNCAATDIRAAVKESIASIEKRLELTADDQRLCSAFRELPADDMRLYYQGNRPPLFVLRRERDELLAFYHAQKSR
jgi:putative glycosyltransferase (TIGR04372 family)